MPSLSAPAANLFASSLPSFFFRRRKQSYELNPPEQSHQVIYLGNVLTAGLGKGEASVDKPLNVIWKTWNSKRGQRQQIGMRLSVTRSGLKAETKQLGLTEYWAHRITFCLAPQQYPRVFCWVYKHEGKRMKPELRCHAVLCKKATEPACLQQMLTEYLQAALQEYKREKLAAERARKMSLVSTCPRRKLLLQTGSLNFRPPVSRSRSAPRLGSIDEEEEEENIVPPTGIMKMEEGATNQGTGRMEEEEAEAGHSQCGEENEEEEEEFSDLDANSINLEAHYRTTPVLSGDSSSQQSAPSVASSTCCDDKREDVDEEENCDENFGDVEDCSLSSASTSSSKSSTSSSSSGNSSLESGSSLLLAMPTRVEEEDGNGIDNVVASMSTFSISCSAANAGAEPEQRAIIQQKREQPPQPGSADLDQEREQATILCIGTTDFDRAGRYQQQKRKIGGSVGAGSGIGRLAVAKGIIFGRHEIRL